MKLNPMTNPGFYRGRPIRDGQGHPASPAPASNNGDGGAGNLDLGSSDGGESNNNGQGFDPAAFWDGPAPAGGASPSGESAGDDSGESDAGGGNEGSLATMLTQQLGSMTFGDPVFNEEIAGQITEGNFTGVQDRLNDMGRNMVRQALAMQVQILKPFAEQLMSQMRNETQSTFTARDNSESLVQLFPAAKNPVMAKTIAPIYSQALKNTNGDRTKAVEQTKEMLRFMAGESASDLNLDVAPRGEGDRGNPAPAFKWLDELTGRR